jgi:hypothetical protein
MSDWHQLKCLCVSTNRLSLRLSVRIEQMSHSLAWVFEVSGLRPDAVFCMSGRSPAGVDYYDAATVRCKSGATIALSGAATIPGHVATSDEKGHGFHLDVRIFGSEGNNELNLLSRFQSETIDLPRQTADYDMKTDRAVVGTGVLSFDIERERLEVRRRDGTDITVRNGNPTLADQNCEANEREQRVFKKSDASIHAGANGAWGGRLRV